MSRPDFVSSNYLVSEYGYGLTDWQREIMSDLLTGVRTQLLTGRGRRAGWTTMLQRVELALKDRSPHWLWDGTEIPEEER